MTVAASRSFFSSRFFISLISLALVLFALGGSLFRYLTTSPRPVTAKDRPIAIATTFVPSASSFSVSLLTSPEALQALSRTHLPDEQAPNEQLATPEIQQLKRRLLTQTGLDYDRDLQPWLGNEITFSLTEPDVDLDESNGAQPGYLLAAAIAPEKQPAARRFLQSLWQQRNLAGKAPQSELISGVRSLYNTEVSTITAASAVVGDRFILLANDVRVLRRSIRAAQSADNLAQNRTYRDTVAKLPSQRVGLAYWAGNGRSHTAMSLELAPSGILAQLRQASNHGKAMSSAVAKRAIQAPTAAMTFLPADSTWAINSAGFSQQLMASDLDALEAIGLSPDELPQFLALGQPQDDVSAQDRGMWNWATGDYALGRVDSDWVLAIERSESDIAKLDSTAQENGFSAVPVALVASSSGEIREAIAWTRFKATQSYRTSSSRLETDVLGLHISQGDYEIFASSLGAMEQALAAPTDSLRDSAQFAQAVATLPNPNSGYLYWNQATAASRLRRQHPLITRTVEPFSSSIRSLSATQATDRDGDILSLFVEMSR